MGAFLVGELQEDLLPFRVFEPFAVALEEFVRAPRLVHAAAAQLLGAGVEQAAGGAFEKQERRARLELRVFRRQLAVSLLENAEMMALLGGELPEYGAAALILGERRGAGVELEAASL